MLPRDGLALLISAITRMCVGLSRCGSGAIAAGDRRASFSICGSGISSSRTEASRMAPA